MTSEISVNITDATLLTDLDTSFVYFKEGTYMIDNEIVNIDTQDNVPVSVLDIDSVKQLTYSTTISHYVSRTDSTHTMSVERYSEERSSLLKSSSYDEQNMQYMFEKLEDKVAFDEFEYNWITVEPVTVTSTDMLFNIIRTRYAHPSPFIKSLFFSSTISQRSLVSYDCHSAQMHALKEILEELNITSHASIPTHTGLRFVQLYNKQLFNSNFKIINEQILTVEDAEASLHLDTSIIRDIVMAAYNMENNLIENFPFNKLLSSLNQSLSIANQVVPTNGTYNIHSSLIDVLSTLHAQVTKVLST